MNKLKLDIDFKLNELKNIIDIQLVTKNKYFMFSTNQKFEDKPQTLHFFIIEEKTLFNKKKLIFGDIQYKYEMPFNKIINIIELEKFKFQILGEQDYIITIELSNKSHEEISQGELKK